ncbi:velvet factor-domain-containing protein [Panaeolus papilionaceus]|nr:velvet factor-domain-containing protein [Panaeolus papilionaceus]
MTVPQFHGCSVANTYDPSPRRIYELIVRQEPKQARMCGVGGKADRRPIDPPPIVQLRVIDPATQQASSSSSQGQGSSRRRRTSRSRSSSPSRRSSTSNAKEGSSGSARDEDDMAIDAGMMAGGYSNFLQNPYYFMFASLARPDDDAELHWLKVGIAFFCFAFYFLGGFYRFLVTFIFYVTFLCIQRGAHQATSFCRFTLSHISVVFFCIPSQSTQRSV